jgi:phosphoglycolate phosphatase
VKLIVFDFDGTLVDSRTLILERHRVVFTEFGLPPPLPQDSLALIGRSLELVLAQLAGSRAPIEDMVRAYRRVLPQLRTESAFAERPFHGITELLRDLSCAPNAVLGIATGHTSAAVAPALDALGWRNFFRTVQAADMAPSKPHPGMLLQALEVTGTRPENAAFIGDTTFDMEMARSAKLRPIGVAWGYHQAERLKAAGAYRVANAVDDLRSCIRDVLDEGRTGAPESMNLETGESASCILENCSRTLSSDDRTRHSR